MAEKKGMPMPKKMGRPPKEINWPQLESLCKIQCTQSEISSVLEVSEDIISENCKKVHGMTFPEFYKIHSDGGKMSLRRAQFKKAVIDGHPTMQVWLGKQMLGQRDHMEFSNAQPITLAYDPHKLGDGE